MIPGTTVDYNATVLSCNEAQFTGLNSFVGGVSNGHVGAAAMTFTNPLTKTLTWRKAWFFFPDDVQRVMIPTIISSSGANVFTVLDQKRHNGPIFVDALPLGPKANFTKPHSLWHDDIGYILDESRLPSTLSVDVGMKTGNWTDIGISAQGMETVDLFAAWIDHGSISPGPFSYTVLPAVNQKRFLRKASRLQVTNIQNDNDVSAAYDAKHRVAMFIFWNPSGGASLFKPGPLDAAITVNSNGNAAVIYNVKKGDITVSDPSQTLTNLTLTFALTSPGERPSGWKGGDSKVINFELPQGGLAGSSVSQKV